MFDKNVKLLSGEILEIPDRLYDAIIEEKIGDLSKFNPDQTDEYFDLIMQEENLLKASHLALKTMSHFQEIEHKCDEFILYLGLYVDKKSHILANEGKQETALKLLTDALLLEESAISGVTPSIARKLTELIINKSEYAIKSFSLFGSIHALASLKTELRLTLYIASTFWEPELSNLSQTIMKEADKFLETFEHEFRPENIRAIHDALYSLKRDFQNQKKRKFQKHIEILENLVNIFLEMLQQEILLNANMKYTSEGLQPDIIQQQTENLIRNVEKRLRILIAKKYAQQYSSSWVQHVESKHKPMFERWQRNIKKDQSAFKVYTDYSPKILDYALIGDLKELINAQWHLFRSVLDFDYKDRNKAVFNDKVTQIINVRNALAHHRIPPVNELLRARVLSTDILIALDRAGEIDT